MNWKRLLCLCLALALALTLGMGAASAQELKKLTVSEPVHLIGYLPLYVAIHEGYFAQEGLEVNVVQATGGAHVTAVVSGDAFAVIGGVDSNCLANQGPGGGHRQLRQPGQCLPVCAQGPGAGLGQ